MPTTFDEVIADTFTVKNDNPTIPPTAWPKLICGVANEVTFQDSSLKLGDQREVFFQSSGQLRAVADIRFLTGSPTATEKLRILPNGHVGIGTQTPAAKLQVAGGAIFDEGTANDVTVKNDTMPSAAWPKLTCDVANVVTVVDSSLKLGDQREVFFQTSGQLRAVADIRFLTGSPTATEKLRILPNGRVGIGTINPGTRLTVQTATSDYGVTHTDGE